MSSCWEVSKGTCSVNIAWETTSRSLSAPRSASPAAVHRAWPLLQLLRNKACFAHPSLADAGRRKRVSVAHVTSSWCSLLRVDAWAPALGLSLKVVCVALATSKPELGTGIGLGIVVPPDYILSTGPRVQRLAATFCCEDKRMDVSGHSPRQTIWIRQSTCQHVISAGRLVWALHTEIFHWSV